ncbi:methyl-accepting chemotaxis protein [Alteromonas sp. KUL49]|uniref:methyl-accepting chemotaxis protein n=1 Tax=Alteromonas sp. KUL49 TaxID=2480798 RepID=UPI00102EF0B1|nr:methyl-accepting chemotaxis protein [Alteromonas sp. KUL49]TAP41498.1 HAMP domain-containing protein [Alteromonas sp. KUL49]
MKIINALSVKSKVFLLVLIPLAALTFFTVDKVNHANKQRQQLQQVDVLLEYFQVLSALLNAYQEELMYSNFFVEFSSRDKDDPRIGDVSRKLKEARVNVDTSYRAYKAYVNATDNQSVLNSIPTLQTSIKKIQERLNRTNIRRDIVDQGKKNAPNADGSAKIWPLGEMRTTVSQLVQSAVAVTIGTAQNKQLSALSNAFYSILRAKSTNMLLLVQVFQGAETNVSGSRFAAIISAKNMEATFLEDFKNYASSSVLKAYNARIGDNQDFSSYLALVEEIRKKASNQIGNQIDVDRQTLDALHDAVVQSYGELQSDILRIIQEEKSQQLQRANVELTTTVCAALVMIAVILVFSKIIISSIVTPLRYLVQLLRELSTTKNLTLRSDIKENNEIGELSRTVNTLIDSFESTLSLIKENIASLKGSSQDVASSMETSFSSIEQQNEATHSISVAVEELSATIEEVVNVTQVASENAEQALSMAVISEQDVIRCTESMEHLSEELVSTQQLVTQLNEQSESIGQVTKIITGIAEQTNLLALNAAIEAARAGENGRGFAVVADEVRELSMRTQQSTIQIQQNIEALSTGAQATLDKVSTLEKTGKNTLSVVEAFSTSFGKIKSSLNAISDINSQIAVSSREQSTVAQDITMRISLINDNATDIAQKGNHVLSTSMNISENTATLHERISVFEFD